MIYKNDFILRPFMKGGWLDFWQVIKYDPAKIQQGDLHIKNYQANDLESLKTILKEEKKRLIGDHYSRKNYAAVRESASIKAYKIAQQMVSDGRRPVYKNTTPRPERPSIYSIKSAIATAKLNLI